MAPAEPTRTRSAGGVVIGERGTIVLVRARGGDGSFLFPKGHVDPGETDEQAACREIKEEAGLQNLELLDDLGMFERHAINQDGSYNVAVLKQVHMFLFAAHETTLAPTMEMEEARWVPFREMGAIIGNEKERAWFSSVSERVREAIQRD